MPARPAAFRPSRSFQVALLTGVSALALVLTGAPVRAMQLATMRGGAFNATANAAAAVVTNSQQAQQTTQQSMSSLLRATQAVQSMQQAQTAARAAAANAASAGPGLSAVPNGLAVGGLQPAVSAPVSAANDPTGLATWEGAGMPTQIFGANGTVNVTVNQTKNNAVLDWTSFNVGAQTTLTFDQQGNASWVALNRVVGSTAPSQILGSVKADGTVLVINQNGIVFGAGAQVNVNSLIASSLDIGGSTTSLMSVQQRNLQFEQQGLLGASDTTDVPDFSTLSPSGPVEGGVTVDAGATITANSTATSSGLILLTAPHVENAGNLTAPDGQVALESGRYIFMQPSTGTSSSPDPNVRGFVFIDQGAPGGNNDYYAWNQSTGFIEADRGNISMGSVSNDAVAGASPVTAAIINDGVLLSTTSVSRNGSIVLDGGDVKLSPGSLIAIEPDTDGETIPTDPTTLSEFKTSSIEIEQEGTADAGVGSVEIDGNATIYAPSANITIGNPLNTTGIFVDNGAVIDASGLENVSIPATRNQVTITPVKGNELANDPDYRAGFLNGATVYLDPRLSGVREDGVAWIGSPLIDAEAFYQLVGVQADELMTTGGNVSFNVAPRFQAGSSVAGTPAIVVKSGAVINIAGGWVSYQAGMVRQTLLVDASGNIVPIGQADPFDDTFVGIYGSFAVDHSHWGVTEYYTGGLKSDETFDPAYTEGRDAGSLTLEGSSQILDGTIYAQAFPGQQQIADGEQGTGTSTIAGDQRLVQAANSQLPAGGFLNIVGAGSSVFDNTNVNATSGDIEVVASGDYKPLPNDTAAPSAPQVQADGSLATPAAVAPSADLLSRMATISLSDQTLSGSGFSEVSLASTGRVTVARDAVINLDDGGVFNVLAGRAITIDGSVIAPSGAVNLETYDGLGSVFASANVAPQLGDFDITINGELDVAGRWVNDFGQPDADMEGGAWLNGGTISLTAAPRVLSVPGGVVNADGLITPYGGATYQSAASTDAAQDISGSILVNPGSLLDLSGGGRIDQKGNFTLTAKGGNLSLKSETVYFQLFGGPAPDDLSGFRVDDPIPNPEGGPPADDIQINPDAITARVEIDPDAIEAHGFGGGGTFSLTTPEFSFGTDSPATGTELPMDFFSQAGFSTYNITSYKTDFFASTFTNGEGGYNAVLATQVLTIGPGQNLPLQQSYLPVELTFAQRQGLFALPDGAGSDILSVVQPTVPSDAWDQKPISLTLGGLIELDVAPGGSITGAAGASLTVSKLLNAGTIRLPGGTLTQQEILPQGYAGVPVGGNNPSGIASGGIHQLSDIFTIAPDGSIDPNAISKVVGGGSNQSVADNTNAGIYFLGTLDADQGVVLAPGSTTDLSGATIINPYAVAANGTPLTQGRIVGGGTITAVQAATTPVLFQTVPIIGGSFFNSDDPTGQTDPDMIVADPGSLLNISGTSGAFDQFVGGVGIGHIGGVAGYVMTPVWSDAGSINANNGGTFTGATILAHGGAPEAQGGTLTILDPILAQQDPSTPAKDVVSADMISSSGIDTLVAIGSVTSSGDVTLRLGSGFFLEGRPELAFQAANNTDNRPAIGLPRISATINTDLDVPTVATTGVLEIDAPDISVESGFDVINNPAQGKTGTGSVVLKATEIDVTGSLLFDTSVADATLDATDDIRFTGVPTWQSTFLPASNPPSFTLNGALAANGNISLIAGQVYPTTGSSYIISSTAANGTISFGRSSDDLPAIPYSAGGNLTVLATNIVQGGVIRVPFGSLTLGSDSAYTKTEASVVIPFAPATQGVTFADGSVTSVSAGGLNIPYGTTTDQTEWFFSPTSAVPLTAPPAKIMTIAGANIEVDQGATLDLSGGGDVYAYEFIPGTGGSRDVLSQQNADVTTGNNGLAYPDGRQVYAIVPGLSNASEAAYDPIYSANYAALSSPSGAGQRVYLSGGNGLTAGWYTLLPAQYALLPGGMRVVEQTGATNVIPGSSFVQPDGSLLVSGYFGNAFSGSQDSQPVQFSVDFQAQILGYSQIAATSGTTLATQAAQRNNLLTTPPVGADAGRLVLAPLATLVVNAQALTAPASGGRGAEVDVGGTDIDILSSLDNAPADGAIHVTATSLDNLNADSLLIGATRTDNQVQADFTGPAADNGTTDLDVSAQHILVANDAAHPLEAPEIILVVDDLPTNSVASTLTLADGATIIASGTVSDTRSGDYVIDGAAESSLNGAGETVVSSPENSATGALFRVSNGPQRGVERNTNNFTPVVPAATLSIGNVNVQGQSVLLDTSNEMSIAANAALHADSLALDAPAIVLSTSETSVSGAVVIGPATEALLSQAGTLILRAQTTIGFDDGTYQFGNTTFDAQDLVSRQGGNVDINAGDVALGNVAAAGTAVAGTGTLDVQANSITFGDIDGGGDIATSGFGTVALTGRNGMFIAPGSVAVFDAGSASLTLTTPYIGDRAVSNLPTEIAGNATVETKGALTITSVGTTALDLSTLNGLPGSSLILDGNGIVVVGAALRATAGELTLASTSGIALSGGATLSTPGYARTFGDAVDPQTVSAPGGTLSLSAANGGIALGNATLSVGGGTGNAGTLVLSAPNGAVDIGGATLNGTGGAGGTGGTFSLTTAGSVDLVALNNAVSAQGFTGGFDVETETGDIDLAAGQTIRSGSVSLTADGGRVDIAGTIDTSGVNGGDIDLYGDVGVTLEATALLDAHANGYVDTDPTDSRQAHAGDVTLGTDFLAGTTSTDPQTGVISGISGTIHVINGAVIDVSAKHPGDRLVELLRNGTVFYQFVPGDTGGTVTLRAPVVGDTVDVTVDNPASIKGAQEIDLEGYRRWDLAAVAASGNFTGVTVDPTTPNTIDLDVSAGLDTANADGSMTTVAGLNFLGDEGPGTLVDFVQNFDVSADYANLHGLASQANFQARPGIELDYTGNITLVSNWNFAAGAVNIAAAEAAGLMAVDPTSGQAYVVPGEEGALLAAIDPATGKYITDMLYRVGGNATGAAPILSLRAGGNLHLKGSVTDGFFEFADQDDPTYLSFVNELPPSDFTVSLNAWNFDQDLYDTYAEYLADNGTGNNFFLGNLDFAGVQTNPGTGPSIAVPYSVLGNSPAALGSGPGGIGDPVDNAVILPLLPDGRVVASSTYRLTAGASLGSIDPSRAAATGTGDIIVDGPKSETLTVNDAASPPAGTLLRIVGPESQTLFFDGGEQGFDTFLEQSLTGVTADTEITLIDDSGQYQSIINAFVAAHPGVSVNRNDGNFGQELDMPLSTMALFVEQVLPQLGSGQPSGGGGGVETTSVNILQQTVVRTGTGSIKMAAAGNVDLTGGSTIQYVATDGTTTQDPSSNNGNVAQLGGAAVYTAGHPVYFVPETLIDPVTGTPVAITAPDLTPVDPSAVLTPSGVADLASSGPVYLEGGGDIDISAGQDVLGRRDLSQEFLINNAVSNSDHAIQNVGSAAEPWRVVTVDGSDITSTINTAAFRSGVAALGGGNITIAAGRDVSDLSVDSDHSEIPVSATPKNGLATLAELSFGSGDIDVTAGRDILGGSFELANGSALISAGRNIADGPESVDGEQTQIIIFPDGSVEFPTIQTFLADPVQLSIDDATIALDARGSISFQGITALGSNNAKPAVSGAGSLAPADLLTLEGLYSAHSGISLLADGDITAYNDNKSTPVYTLGSENGVYPASLSAASLSGNLDIQVTGANGGAQSIELVPSPVGQLDLFAGGNILPTVIAMLDSDPGELPGLFSSLNGITFGFPDEEPDATDLTKREDHNAIPTHENDPQPIYVYADGDIGDTAQGVTLWVPKQARIDAGQDIINMMFFGQNLQSSDITRIVAGRDIIATTELQTPLTSISEGAGQINTLFGAPQLALLGNTFVLGGPGQLFLEAGRNMGPFLNSADVDQSFETATAITNTNLSFGGGVMSVGDDDNPFLPTTGASVNVLFGVAKGADFDALRDDYVAPGTAANAAGDYSDKLIAWMQQNEAQELLAAYGTTNVDANQAYAVFLGLPELNQEIFLLADVYFNELQSTDTPNPVYTRGYQAVNTLFPASLGYTANNLAGGTNGANQLVQTGNLDLRLATIETTRGGDVRILGPGGNVLAGSVVSTSVQASRRAYLGYQLYDGFTLPATTTVFPETIQSIPTGDEGVLTLRGGDIDSFTDGSFEVNQSRVFTEEGGDILMWSSNGDLNAGKGAKTTASFPPVVVQIDDDAFTTVDALGGVTGAGIATLQSTPDSPRGDTFLIAPRGTVDAGDAGVRVSGDLAVAALHVLNADNFAVQGTSTGIPTVTAPNIGALNSASNAAGAATKAIDSSPQGKASTQASILIVEIEGYGGDDGESEPAQQNDGQRKKNQQRSQNGETYDPSGALQLVGNGRLTPEQEKNLTADEKRKLDQLMGREGSTL